MPRWRAMKRARRGRPSVLTGLFALALLLSGGWLCLAGRSPLRDVEVLGGLGVLGGVLLLAGSSWRSRRVLSAELIELDQTLVRRVAERTQTLAAANDQLERDNQRLAELGRQKSEFFSNVSHELRTPLTVCVGLLGELVAGHRGELPAESLEYLHSALAAARQLIELINQLLDFARLEAGRYELRFESVSLGPAVADIVEAFAHLARQRGLTLQRAGAEATVIALCDRDALRKVLNNLLSNALKFTPKGGLVSVRVTAEGDDAVLEVEDTGPGIAPELHERIFERFYQANSSASREHSGTGIGLAFVRELIDLHGGAIELRSGIGAGASFRVRLPLAPEGIGAEPAAATPPPPQAVAMARVRTPAPPASSSAARDLARVRTPPPQPSAAGWILLVEDNPEVARLMADVLEPSFPLRLARNGEEALAQMANDLPDLVISDVMMPRMTGLELCERLRTGRKTSSVPVLLVSARADHADRLEALNAGASDYLVKPFDPRELQVRAANLVGLRERDRFLDETNSRLARSLSELRKTQAELVVAEKMAVLGTLAAGIGHELNNALNIIKGNFPVLREYVEAHGREVDRLSSLLGPNSAPSKELGRMRRELRLMLDEMAGASARATDVVSGLRQLTRQAATSEDEKADLRAVVERCVEIVAAEHRGRVTLETQITGQAFDVRGHPVEIEQVMLNLLRNAAHFSLPDGIVEVTLQELAGERLVRVRDHGQGIAAADLPRIFDPFFTTRPVGQGMGLGLAITAVVVRRNGGQVEAKSWPGEGAELTVRLPPGSAARAG